MTARGAHKGDMASLASITEDDKNRAWTESVPGSEAESGDRVPQLHLAEELKGCQAWTMRRSSSHVCGWGACLLSLHQQSHMTQS